MKLYIDATKCDGYGICAEIAPDIFKLDERGRSFLAVDGELDSESAVLADEAVAGCPKNAISTTNAGGTRSVG